jgi:ATP-dependent RNA helicase RhlE
MRDPAIVQTAPVSTTAAKIEEAVYRVEKRDKPALLAHLVQNLPMYRTLVFTRTKHGADRVVRDLHTRGIRAEAIHGNKSQGQRQRALANFVADRIPVLVATDIASRGIDVDGITHVVNYDLTHEPETYVHRIGRTARAGASGSALSFCDAEEVSNLKAIERLIRRPIPSVTNPLPASANHGNSHASHASHSNRSSHGSHASHSRPQPHDGQRSGQHRPHHAQPASDRPQHSRDNGRPQHSHAQAQHPRSGHAKTGGHAHKTGGGVRSSHRTPGNRGQGRRR